MPLLTPAQAIIGAADAAPRFFLNSQPDYRDQRNLSVAIHPQAMRAVRARFGNNLTRAFVGRTVRVLGRADACGSTSSIPAAQPGNNITRPT